MVDAEPPINLPEILPVIDRVETDSMIDRYLYMYTKGAEIRFKSEPISADHMNEIGSTCRITIDTGKEPKFLYFVTFTIKNENALTTTKRYYRPIDGEMEVEVGGDYIGTQEPTALLIDLENFFGILDSEDLLRSQYETAEYRNKVLFDRAGPFGSFGGSGIKANLGAPNFYSGYGSELMDDDSYNRTEGLNANYSTFNAVLSEVESQVAFIISNYQFPIIVEDVIRKVLFGRITGLTDKAIFRQLARAYHPDLTELDKAEAEEIFKLILSQLYNPGDGFAF